jgi:hypothetical protein
MEGKVGKKGREKGDRRGDDVERATDRGSCGGGGNSYTTIRRMGVTAIHL